MLERMISDPTLGALKRGLAVAALRHEVIAGNLANVDTPGYKRARVDFANYLGDALERAGGRVSMARTDPRHISPERSDPGGPVVRVETDTTGRLDGNNVDIDVEMTLLAENALWYQALVRQVAEKFGRWRSAITEGRR